MRRLFGGSIKLMMVAGIWVAAIGSSRAADNCTGSEETFDTQTETFELGKDHSLMLARSASIVLSEDAPFYHLTTGECTNSVLTTPDGKIQGSGHCLRRDKDGDSWSIEWSLPPGTDKGTWKSVGGTGKFASKQVSGWWQEVRRDGKMAVIKWGGVCK